GVDIWRLEEGGLTLGAEVLVPNWPVHTLAFSPKGDKLAFGAGDNMIRLWRADSHEQPTQIAVSDDNHIRGLGFAADGRGLLALDTEGRLMCLELGTGRRRDQWRALPMCRIPASAPALRRVMPPHHDGTARLMTLPDWPVDR